MAIDVAPIGVASPARVSEAGDEQAAALTSLAKSAAQYGLKRSAKLKEEEATAIFSETDAAMEKAVTDAELEALYEDQTFIENVQAEGQYMPSHLEKLVQDHAVKMARASGSTKARITLAAQRAAYDMIKKNPEYRDVILNALQIKTTIDPVFALLGDLDSQRALEATVAATQLEETRKEGVDTYALPSNWLESPALRQVYEKNTEVARDTKILEVELDNLDKQRTLTTENMRPAIETQYRVVANDVAGVVSLVTNQMREIQINAFDPEGGLSQDDMVAWHNTRQDGLARITERELQLVDFEQRLAELTVEHNTAIGAASGFSLLTGQDNLSTSLRSKVEGQRALLKQLRTALESNDMQALAIFNAAYEQDATAKWAADPRSNMLLEIKTILGGIEGLKDLTGVQQKLLIDQAFHAVMGNRWDGVTLSREQTLSTPSYGVAVSDPNANPYLPNPQIIHKNNEVANEVLDAIVLEKADPRLQQSIAEQLHRSALEFNKSTNIDADDLFDYMDLWATDDIGGMLEAQKVDVSVLRDTGEEAYTVLLRNQGAIENALISGGFFSGRGLDSTFRGNRTYMDLVTINYDQLDSKGSIQFVIRDDIPMVTGSAPQEGVYIRTSERGAILAGLRSVEENINKYIKTLAHVNMARAGANKPEYVRAYLGDVHKFVGAPTNIPAPELK